MDGVEQIVYINLAERPEKQRLIETELRRCVPKNSARRFDAIKLPNSTGYGVDGYIGSYMSHIAVLKMAMNAGWAICLILEDDAAFNRFDQGDAVLAKLMAAPYDVILLGGLGHCDPVTYRITSPCQTSIAYLVTRDYYSLRKSYVRQI